ncbi:MAG: radical SAM protein [Clostridia bacterium]|nr:radical SAM protein [Clostridia bacterium]
MDYMTKISQLTEMAKYKEKLRKEPILKFLFFELTMRCNERCLHCGSYCGDVTSEEMPVEKYYELLDKVKQDFDTLPMLCITGGEPLLRKEFFDIMSYANKLGYKWGMTSNGTLITNEVAKRLEETGMRTISISLDGLEENHDSFRRTKGGFKKAVDGIKNLLKYDFSEVQVTTVVNKKNIDDLDGLFELMQELDVDSWRVVNLEPMGRALSLDGYMLEKGDYIRLFEFIKTKREQGYPLTYGCTHYLGLEYEKEVRDWYFICSAGVYTASILANGDICACLDIERRSETIEGNILKDDFTDVWKNRFKIFRTPLCERNEKCSHCDSKYFCGGGSYHSWDYSNDRPLICFKDMIF